MPVFNLTGEEYAAIIAAPARPLQKTGSLAPRASMRSARRSKSLKPTQPPPARLGSRR
jgi:hypothetical protein